MATNRLPIVSGDTGNWGTVLNSFLSYALVSKTVAGIPTASVQAGALSYVSTINSAITTTYTIGSGGNTTGNETVLAYAASNAIAITLTDATAYPGIIHTIKKTDTTPNIVSISTVASQTIDGTNASSTTPIQIKVPYVSLSLASDGSNWYVI